MNDQDCAMRPHRESVFVTWQRIDRGVLQSGIHLAECFSESNCAPPKIVVNYTQPFSKPVRPIPLFVFLSLCFSWSLPLILLVLRCAFAGHWVSFHKHFVLWIVDRNGWVDDGHCLLCIGHRRPYRCRRGLSVLVRSRNDIL